MATLSITGLSKAFGTHQVLSNVDLNVSSGELVAILGASGSGKTTLLRLICGFERADAGTIRIGEDIAVDRHRHLLPEKRRVGYVAQEGALFPHLSVADNIVFGLKRAQRRAHRGVGELLKLVGLPASFATRAPHQLSGGEQQRVALARALAPGPRLILLDEPFSALDAALRAETRQAVTDALTAAGATALLVTHDQAEALSMGSQVAVMRGGRLAQIARPDFLYRQPIDAELAQFVGEAVLVAGIVRQGMVTCCLGELRLAAQTADGAADVLVRPEQIRLLPSGLSSGAGAAIHAIVTGVSFFGPDANVQFQLRDGGQDGKLTTRVPGYLAPLPGDPIRLVVEGEVMAYPMAGDGRVLVSPADLTVGR